MTKHEAKIALALGWKITHKFFLENEYVFKQDDILLTENGENFTDRFLNMKDDNEWQIYEDQKPIVVDNFELINSLLDFSEDNTFYLIQILKRRKENPDMKTGVQVIDNFYIYSEYDLSKLKDKIVEKCKSNNARAYINLNRLNLEKVALYTAKLTVDYIINKDFRSVKNAYSTACGSHHSESNKRWLVDIDEEEMKHKDIIIEIISTLHKEMNNGNEILAEVPTKSGCHIITNPYNPLLFSKILESKGLKIDVHKNSPTILFIP